MDPLDRGHAFDSARSPDTMYGPRPWTERPRYSYLGPFASNQERLVQQALAVADLPGAELQEVVRPPLPQINPFPARFGYDRSAPGIEEVISVARHFPTQGNWISGEMGAYQAASRNTLGNGV